MKYDISKLNIISVSLKDAWLANNNIFSSKLSETITLTIAAIINVIDLLGNLGVSLFYC